MGSDLPDELRLALGMGPTPTPPEGTEWRYDESLHEWTLVDTEWTGGVLASVGTQSIDSYVIEVEWTPGGRPLQEVPYPRTARSIDEAMDEAMTWAREHLARREAEWAADRAEEHRLRQEIP